MATFVWEGRTKSGELRKGNIEASNKSAVIAQLRRQQISPSSVKEKDKGISMELKIPWLKSRVNEKDLAVFTRQFATMIDAGLPLVQCLDILAQQQSNKTFKEVLNDVRQGVEGGTTLAEAMKKHPNTFDNLYANLVAAGEVGGVLDTILNRLAAYIEKSLKLKKQVKSAMVYPSVIFSVAIIAVGIILIFVIPKFQEMFAGFGAALPAPTQLVVNLSKFTRENFILMIVALVGAFIGLKAFRKTERGRIETDKILLRLPIVGELIKKVSIARFSRTLGTMISSGVPILDALDICSKSAGNVIIETAILDARTSISQGKTIAEPLQATKVFPPMVTQMISVGESTGNMDTMLNKIADFYEDEVDAAVSALTSLLEPVMITILGGAIGGMLIAMYLPVFKLAGAIK